MPATLSISMVVHKPEVEEFNKTMQSLHMATQHAITQNAVSQVNLVIWDNTPGNQASCDWQTQLEDVWGASVAVKRNGCNLGFGKGHNEAIRNTEMDFHLILNPDIRMEQDTLVEAIKHMQKHPHTTLISPHAVWPDGQRQYLCKRYPSIWVLFLRGFAPALLKRCFTRMLARYEFRGETEQHVLHNIPITSGCFMFLRTQALLRTGGFSPSYFLYFEDFDFALRLGKAGQISYVPSVKIQHTGGKASKKGLKHIALFIRAAVTFYHRHGWKWI